MVSVLNICQLKDNYCYMIKANNEVIIIDPADSISILKYIDNNQLLLKAILLTHHHADHTAGVEGILNKIQVPVYSPNKKIKYTSKLVKGLDIIDLNFLEMKVIATPGHTIDHVSYHSKINNILFSGDALFRLGCGRIFEGTYKQMFSSLQKIYDLDNATNVYCGHEYTNNNLKFLLSIFPQNDNLLAEHIKIKIQLQETSSSVPFNLGNEKRINPFLAPNSDYLYEFKKDKNLTNFELFCYLRDLKNKFQ